MHGLWSDIELEQASTGGDLWLTTELVNESTFDDRTITAFNQARDAGYARFYLAQYYVDGYETEPVKFRAPNDEMALRWLDDTFSQRPDYLGEQITTYRDIITPIAKGG